MREKRGCGRAASRHVPIHRRGGEPKQARLVCGDGQPSRGGGEQGKGKVGRSNGRQARAVQTHAATASPSIHPDRPNTTAPTPQTRQETGLRRRGGGRGQHGLMGVVVAFSRKGVWDGAELSGQKQENEQGQRKKIAKTPKLGGPSCPGARGRVGRLPRPHAPGLCKRQEQSSFVLWGEPIRANGEEGGGREKKL